MDNSLVNMDNSSDRVVVVVGEVVVVEDTSVREPAALASLLQLDSSDASSQSGVPSQTQEFGIQLPSPQ